MNETLIEMFNTFVYFPVELRPSIRRQCWLRLDLKEEAKIWKLRKKLHLDYVDVDLGYIDEDEEEEIAAL